ncbi:hypothetical protein ARMGADRAFT_1091920 [Armillaria gallica]|uniref:Uncharacterized protein n=1 Tax=Armillaria gallica TaxID=47427 RepID=A0A2H3CFX6_ARMGA|nr:hypothetical protein ARMGADRAFT_1091920 [Armillaria gallica]
MNNLDNVLNIHAYLPLPEEPFPISPTTKTETMPQTTPPVYPVITTNRDHASSTTQVIHKDANGDLSAVVTETSQASIGIVVETGTIHEYKPTMLDKLSGTVYLRPMEGESGITSPALVKPGAPFPPATFDRLAQREAHRGFLFLGRPIYDDHWYGNGLILEILYVSDKYVIFNADFDMPSVQGGNYMITMAAKATDFVLPPLRRCEHIFKAAAKKVGWEFDLDLIPTNAEEDIAYERYSPFVRDWLHAALTPGI